MPCTITVKAWVASCYASLPSSDWSLLLKSWISLFISPTSGIQLLAKLCRQMMIWVVWLCTNGSMLEIMPEIEVHVHVFSCFIYSNIFHWVLVAICIFLFFLGGLVALKKTIWVMIFKAKSHEIRPPTAVKRVWDAALPGRSFDKLLRRCGVVAPESIQYQHAASVKARWPADPKRLSASLQWGSGPSSPSPEPSR